MEICAASRPYVNRRSEHKTASRGLHHQSLIVRGMPPCAIFVMLLPRVYGKKAPLATPFTAARLRGRVLPRIREPAASALHEGWVLAVANPNVLWLAHAIPYPPRAGFLLRSYNLLRALARRQTVDLVAFVQ